MSEQRISSVLPGGRRPIADSARAIKARCCGAGLLLTDLAAAAGIRKSTLSDYLAGRIGRTETQYDIYNAFIRLTMPEDHCTIYEFWGPLFHGRKVAI